MKTYTREDIGPNDTCRWVRLVDVEAEMDRVLALVNDRDAEIERLSIENEKWRLCREFIPSEKQEMLAEIERLNTAFDRVQRASEFVVAEDGRRIYDLTVEIERLRADLVWAVRKGVMVGHDECLRPCIWFDVHRGVEYDGTDAGLLAAVDEARGRE